MTRLLLVGDMGRPTGFEKVVRNLAQELSGRGYEVTVRGLGYAGDDSDSLTYPNAPFTVKPADSTFADPMGFSQVARWITEDTPDVLLVVQDLWNIAQYAQAKPIELPFVAYVPVDAPNVPWANALGLAGVSELVTYTQFGARECAAGVQQAVDLLYEKNNDIGRGAEVPWFELPKGGAVFKGRMDRLSRWDDPENVNVIPHGFEHALFAPQPKDVARTVFGIPADAFVVSNIGTNQQRKRLDLTIRAFGRFKQLVPSAHLVLHCAGWRSDAPEGYNLPQLVRLYGLTGSVSLVHETHGELTTPQLNALYATADVNINTSGGEGWGLCSMESAACGVPQIVPRWSATGELWEGAAGLLTVDDYSILCRPHINAAHAVIDVGELVGFLYMLWGNPEVRARWAKDAAARAAAQKSWAQVAGAFDAVLSNAIAEGPPRAVSLSDIRVHRRAPIRSEIANRLR